MFFESVVPGRDDDGERDGVGDVFVGADVDASELEVITFGSLSAGEILSFFASVEHLVIFWDDPKLSSAVPFEDLAGC